MASETKAAKKAVKEATALVSSLETEIQTHALRDLALLETNARFMRHEQYQQLVANLKRDGALTSVPLVAPREDGRLEVLSGNHRVQAALDAGIEAAPVMVILSELSPEQRIALQLSHNAIAGQDDPAILAALYESLDEIDWRIYAGLDDKTLGLLDQVKPGALTEVNLEFTSLSIVFLPEELDRIERVAHDALPLVSADSTWLAKFADHTRLLDAFANISQSYNVTNTATLMDLFLDLFERNQHQIVEGWWDETSDTTKHNKYVPIAPVTGVSAPAESLAVIRKAIEKGQHGNSSIPGWKVLEEICGKFLSGE